MREHGVPDGYLPSTPRLGPWPPAVGPRSGWDPLPAPPGCSSDLGGPDAPQSVEEAAVTIVLLATHPNGGPTGGIFSDKKRIKW
jgi:hypothetical protein